MSNRSDKLISQCEGTNINEGSPDGRLVYIASPYAGDVVANTQFAIRCCLYAIRQGCTPVAPHLLYPQMLDDSEPEQRAIALKLGHRLLSVCQEVWACGSRISSGMAGEIALAETLCIPVRYLLLKRTIADSCDYAENYDKIKVRPMDINTKGEFPLVV